ncbi:MAG: T9SS type A sorting domain-containing protein [Bacteroidales bacterium]|nr:T9SS type A sorting domain-containing protein [Bacteroidales bacterium]MDP2237085.1 T9SS type A sorting domain-containing protein [Bacteroidales bacterium]
MKQFNQTIKSSTLLSVTLVLTLLFLSLQQSFAQQCVQCDGTTTSGLFPSAIGRYTKATANYSFAGGIYSEANGSASIAFGNRAYATGANSVVLGMFLKTNTSPAIVLGAGFDQNNRLENDVPYSMMIGFGSTKPTLFVSPSGGVNNTGRIGIGNVTDPQAKLHIKADANEDASLLLEPSGNGNFGIMKFADNDHTIKAKTGGNFIFSTQAEKSFVFEYGNMGIGTNMPTATLQIVGNMNVGNNPTGTTGINAFTGGKNSIASGNYSFAYGENAMANGRASFSFGQSTNVYDNYALGIGRYLEVYGSSSIAIGRFLKTLNPESMVIGYGFSETQTLDNNVNRSLMIGFESTKPTFFIGPSNGVNNTGRIGIGNVTDPQAKLHIKADATEEASLRLEPTGSTYNAVVYFTNSGHAMKAKTDGHLTFNTQNTKGFVFETGNMGIGSTDPAAKLHIADGDVFIEDINRGIIMKSPNGQCWRGIMTDQGMLSFTQSTCPNENATALKPMQQGNQLRLFPNPTSNSITVETSLKGQQGRLLLVSPDGTQLSRMQINSDKTELNLGWFVAGTYLIQLEIDGQVVETTKVVKQ